MPLPVRLMSAWASSGRAMLPVLSRTAVSSSPAPKAHSACTAAAAKLPPMALPRCKSAKSAEAAAAMEGLPFRYDPLSRVGIAGTLPEPDGHGTILIATGGTSDQPVAEEAALTAEALGNRVVRLYDVGVAGLHRLLAHLDEIMSAQVIVAIAGMEGALASVIGGLADCPVIAVPTSVGYGASLGGLSALLSMLNSCASGVSVVNIDNGFGAAYQASLINHMEVKG